MINHFSMFLGGIRETIYIYRFLLYLMRCRPPWWRRHHGVATHRCKCINKWLTFSNKHCTNRQRFSSRICRTVWISERLNACPIFEYRSNTQTHTYTFLDVLKLSQWQNTHCFCSFPEECNRSPLWVPFGCNFYKPKKICVWSWPTRRWWLLGFWLVLKLILVCLKMV